jgi:2-hydroxy-3-oxopropionate reductase
LEASQEFGAPLPLTASIMEIMQGLKGDYGDADHGAIVRYYEKQANIEVSRPKP